MGGDRKHVTICSHNSGFNKALRLMLEETEVRITPVPDDGVLESDLLLWRIDGEFPTDRLSELTSSVPTLVLAESQRLMDAVDAGCIGFLTHDASLDEVADAVITVLNGGAIVPPNLLGTVLHQLVRRRRNTEQLVGTSSLTDREREVFLLATEGLRKEEIGERLYISPDTARTHLQRIYRKLGVHSQAELMAWVAHGSQDQTNSS